MSNQFIPPDEVFDVRCKHPAESVMLVMPNPSHEKLFSRPSASWLPFPETAIPVRVCGICRHALADSIGEGEK